VRWLHNHILFTTVTVFWKERKFFSSPNKCMIWF
jgi:hypothetical protein